MALVPRLRAKPSSNGPIRLRSARTDITPIPAEYRDHFPVGVWLGGDVDVYTPGSHASTDNINPNYNSGWTRFMQDTVIGLRENNLGYALHNNGAIGSGTDQSEMEAGTSPILDKLDTSTRKGRIHFIFGPNAESIISDYLDDTDGTALEAETAVSSFFSTYSGVEDHRSIMAWQIGDDITIANKGQQAVYIANAFQALDPYGRPAPYTCTDKNVWALDDDLRVALAYSYPCGVRPDGDVAPEGDFHRSTFSTFGGGDWVDRIRDFTDDLPAGVPLWFALQCHGNAPFGGTGVTTSAIRKPTAAELRAMFGILVAEGIKGIFFFTWGNNGVLSEGLAHITENVALRYVAAECAGRLTEPIRQTLLHCDRVADKFTASGGGSTGYDIDYANAHITTQQHRESGTYYVTVVNHSTSEATITIDSATQIGHLVNLENGSLVPLRGTITLAGLDWAIFRHNNLLGDLRIVPIDYEEGVEAYWARHWANPDSLYHVDSDDIPTHPHEVTVTPETFADLSGAAQITSGSGTEADPYIYDCRMDESFPPTTYRLTPGDYDRQVWVGKPKMHFVADDPENPPNVKSFTFIVSPPWVTAYDGTALDLTKTLRTDRDPDRIDEWLDLPSDIIFRDLNFTGGRQGGGESVFDGYNLRTLGNLPNALANSSTPITHRGLNNVLAIRCTFDDFYQNVYKAGETDLYGTIPDGTWHYGHNGFINSQSGTNWWVLRDCTFTGVVPSGGSRGSPAWGVYFDGAHGAILQNCHWRGRFNSGAILGLTNQDFTFSRTKQGNMHNEDIRSCAYCVIDRPDIQVTSGPATIEFKGREILISNPSWVLTGTHQYLISLTGQSAPEYETIGATGALVSRYGFMKHELYNVIVRDGDVSGGSLVDFVIRDSNPTYASLHPADATNIQRGRLGRTTVVRNHVDTLTGDWLVEKTTSGTTPTVASDGPDVVEDNTTGA